MIRVGNALCYIHDMTKNDQIVAIHEGLKGIGAAPIGGEQRALAIRDETWVGNSLAGNLGSGIPPSVSSPLMSRGALLT